MSYFKAIETAGRPYFILVEYDKEMDEGHGWIMNFGDYDKQTVKDQLESEVDNGQKRKNLKILEVNGDKQKDIDKAIADLNKALPRGPDKVLTDGAGRMKIEKASGNKPITMSDIRDVAFMYVDAPANKLKESTPISKQELGNILYALWEQSSIDDYKLGDFKDVNTLGKLFGVLQKQEKASVRTGYLTNLEKAYAETATTDWKKYLEPNEIKLFEDTAKAVGPKFTGYDYWNWLGEDGIEDEAKYNKFEAAVKKLMGKELFKKAEGVARADSLLHAIISGKAADGDGLTKNLLAEWKKQNKGE